MAGFKAVIVQFGHPLQLLIDCPELVHIGRQYVVITAAGHHFMETLSGDYVIAYALPEAK